jgi:single-strand DNA-binding protein
MAGDVTITIIGNLVGDPEVRFTTSGTAIAGFTVAVNASRYNREANRWEDAGTSFYRCEAWKLLGEHVAESLSKGLRVIVQGRWAEQHWNDKETGDPRSGWKLTVDAIGPDLAFATATVRKMARNGQTAPDDAWANGSRTRPAAPATKDSAPAGNGSRFEDDEPPF